MVEGAVMIEFDSMNKLKDFVDKKIAELSGELGELLRRLDLMHSNLEVKKKLLDVLNVKGPEKPYEGVKLGGDIILHIDPPGEALIAIMETASEEINKKLNAYKNLKAVLSKIPVVEMQLKITLFLENDVPKHIVLTTT